MTGRQLYKLALILRENTLVKCAQRYDREIQLAYAMDIPVVLMHVIDITHAALRNDRTTWLIPYLNGLHPDRIPRYYTRKMYRDYRRYCNELRRGGYKVD